MVLGYQNPFYLKKFVGDFKSLTNEADASLAKHKALELEIERLLKAVVSQDIMNIVQKESVVDTSDLQTELERTKALKTISLKKKMNMLNFGMIDNTKTRRPQPKSNTKNDRVPSASKSSRSNNNKAKVEEHHRNLLLSKNNKHISSACNNIKIDSQDVISKVVCAMCKKCLISINHDKCLRNYVNDKNSCGKKQKAKVSFKENQMKYQPKVKKPKKVIQICLWCVDSGCSKHMTGNLKILINFVWKFMGTVRFENDHVDAILGFGQFCDSDLEVTFRRNACFIRNLDGVDLLKGDRSTNLYTINLHEMASASPICLMA
uniref:Integrase, catalytic region, zinc finger, CCHC-type, peptidase aspartic, catalytic n=1 Tax=Tanacetum cinerariifolium TaxID=118510 RepID=A0A6L2MHW2_TANCI|nr:integrase, catalytic region, zinc finger, CCHC-type, peptidase aspartic, catalytic [Tanacetum cinerariifolium]